MDFSTLIGFVIGSACIIGAVLAGGDGAVFIDANALMLVGGGVIAAAFVMFPLREVAGAPRAALKAFSEGGVKLGSLIGQIVELSRLARINGILALEEAEKELDNSFLKKGVALAVDGNEESLIRAIMSTEIRATRERHAVGIRLFKALGLAGLAFGLAGTLIGLITLLPTLDTATSGGQGLAGAFVPLFYGVVAASLVFFPLAAKLELRSKQEALAKEVITEGVISIIQGGNPRVLQDKLEAFVAPHQRRGR